ncbi:phosphoenolpyruvate carboxylase [Candidatus Peregrinibacteria bacterium]|nr:phosphoenolpyruvate carboxylase [Candidatus Peregrinibacteria bacterium]
MATQHPDNACKTYFTGKRALSSQDEIEECYRCFSELGIHEYMWDWEGKFVDEAVVDRLYNTYHDYFQKHPLGRDEFLTFRIPNIWIESSHKLPRAFMNLLSSEKAALHYKFHSPPLFEIILPMTTRADQLIYLQKAFSKIATATEEIFELKTVLSVLSIIPLFEELKIVEKAPEILREYVHFLKEEYDAYPEYLRVFTARSDPALNAGFLSAKLMNKLALHLYQEFESESGIPVYPIVGAGSLPFRGGLNPENIDAAIEEYKGVATLTIQSAFRYDYDYETVKKIIEKINTEIPKNRGKSQKISPEEQKLLRKFTNAAEKFYRPIIESSAEMINAVAEKLPSHRERVLHIGLFGYSRGMGKVQLPRAIHFTGALYSLGVPPELIGSGRALRFAKEQGMLDLINTLCPYLKEDFRHAGHYLNRENLDHLCKEDPLWEEVKNEIQDIEKHVGIPIGPEESHHIIHRNFTSNIYHKLKIGEDFSEDILQAAEIRKSLG